MAEQKYKDYLAAKILTEGQPVTYKQLSRALQINVSVAKWMLFDFHQKQNAKKADSIHATYLIYGTKRSVIESNGTNGRVEEDASMRSSPFMSSMPEQELEQDEEPVKKSTMLVIREEELAHTRAEFSEEASIQIYSLEPGPLENLNILAACHREPDAKVADEDPLKRWRVYGTIQNPYIKSTGTKNKTAGDIFKSFAKAKAKPKDAAKSTESTPAPVEDEPMQGMSEDEGDDDEPEVQVDTEKIEAAKKARDERAEKLRKMMEDDDEDMPDAPAAEEREAEPPQLEKADAPKEDEPEPTVTVENGRRRGKRRVMKKKTVKDEEGYLVTKEEAIWESFSEDEPQPKRAKPVPKPASAAKGKPAGKKGQGSIASFFTKKA
ncbi:hypothetical protein SLS59_003387 [Nothophoma quercina]|uniref:DNA polymerase delta subunit 3 n=1 Tax=Nothophoma quercina TaxID=749835 RepID=A0ABR3RMC9_9PLEO